MQYKRYWFININLRDIVSFIEMSKGTKIIFYIRQEFREIKFAFETFF